MIFCKNLTEFYQISLKILVNLTDFSPQYGMYDLGPSVVCQCHFCFLRLGNVQCHRKRDTPVRQCHREGY